MLPVGVILSCFFVYGTLIRERSIFVLQSAGINVYRLFLPVVVLGVILTVLQFFAYEFITIPATRKLEDLRRIKIERKYGSITTKRYNLYLQGKDRLVYFIYEFETVNPLHGELSGTMRNFIIVQFNKDSRLQKRYDGSEAVYNNHQWQGKNISVRLFQSDTVESFMHYDTLTLAIKEKPGDFTDEVRAIEELSVWDLRHYIQQLKIAGLKTAKSEVEFHYRFSSSFIGLVLILLSLPLAVKLRRGGVMFGLGLGLLFSFIYWGLVQITKAYGQASIISPFWAVWFANFLFLIVDAYFIIRVKQ
jgi:lipopolysaccharide export system permease protein